LRRLSGLSLSRGERFPPTRNAARVELCLWTVLWSVGRVPPRSASLSLTPPSDSSEAKDRHDQSDRSARISEFERCRMKEHVRAGIGRARAQGVRLGRRPGRIDPERRGRGARSAKRRDSSAWKNTAARQLATIADTPA
jgi:hypothetical protein